MVYKHVVDEKNKVKVLPASMKSLSNSEIHFRNPLHRSSSCDFDPENSNIFLFEKESYKC
jgi:hypothetical protein